MKSSRFVSVGGILVAMSLTLMYLGSLSPGGKFGCCAAAGAVVSMPLIRRKVRLSVAVYTVTVTAGIFIIPVKSMVLWYALVFGLYALVKYAAENFRRHTAEIALKLAYFNLMLMLVAKLAKEGFITFAEWTIDYRASVIILILNAIFILYDVVFSRLIGLMRHIIFHIKF